LHVRGENADWSKRELRKKNKAIEFAPSSEKAQQLGTGAIRIYRWASKIGETKEEDPDQEEKSRLKNPCACQPATKTVFGGPQ